MLAKIAGQDRFVLWSLFCFGLMGCGGSAPQVDARAGRMVYVDTATMQPLVHDAATSFPAEHPQTGKRTLRPALYCPTCQKWYPAPAAEQVNHVRGAGLCPKDKTPLTAEGPWPNEAAAMPSRSK